MYRNAYKIPDPCKLRKTQLKGQYNLWAWYGIIPCKILIKAYFFTTRSSFDIFTHEKWAIIAQPSDAIFCNQEVE